MTTCGGVAGSSATVYGSGPRMIAHVAGAEPASARRPSGTTQALAADHATRVSGASSWMRSDHGGSSTSGAGTRRAPGGRRAGRRGRPSSASRRRTRMESSVSTMERLTEPAVYRCMTTRSNHRSFVLGGTGKTGRRVAERLARSAAGPDRLALGHPPFDWDDRGTWAPALDGTSAPPTSPTTPTSPSRAPPRRSAPSPAGRRRRRAPAGAAVRPRRARGRSAPSRPCATLRRRLDDRALRAGSPRTSARTSCSTACSAARSRCRPATSPSRSSTSTTSPTSRSPR